VRFRSEVGRFLLKRLFGGSVWTQTANWIVLRNGKIRVLIAPAPDEPSPRFKK
jgi:hypothetical protein